MVYHCTELNALEVTVFDSIDIGYRNHLPYPGSAAKMRTVIADWSPAEKARVKVFQINFAEPLRVRKGYGS